MREQSRIVIHDGAYVYKRPNVNRYIRRVQDLDDLKTHRREFSREEYYSLYQTFLELEIYNLATWEERNYFAPPLKFIYDNKNVPVVVFPYIQPIRTPEEADYVEEDEALTVLTQELHTRGMPDDQIENAIERISEVCSDFNLNLDDILGNLSNCGYNAQLGFRVIDFGLDEEFVY